jgi:AcrR family transcriptional regulator
MVNTKVSIFNTALRLFASQGYEATTTLQVARQVGVTEPAVFYYFKNKNELFLAVLETASSNYLEQLEKLNEPGKTAFEAIGALIHMHFAIVEQEPEYMRILLRACPTRLRDHESVCIAIYRKIRSKLQETTAGILAKGVASNTLRPVDIEATAKTLIALLLGLMTQQITAPGKISAVEAAAVDFCRSGLMSPTVIKKRRRDTKTARAL